MLLSQHELNRLLMHEVQFMSRKAQFMKSQISIHAEGNSLISSSMKSLYHKSAKKTSGYTNHQKYTIYVLLITYKRKIPQAKILVGLKITNNYLFENCGARRAALRPYFFLSFILESLVRKPAALRTGLYSSSIVRRALAIPCLIAPA